MARYGELTWSPTLEAQVARISISSVARHLPSRPPEARARKPAAPLNRHQQALPAYRIPRDIAEPGDLELDLVHHSDPVTEGEYVYTLQLIDVATGWGAHRAIMGRSYIVVADALAHLFAQLPFPVREPHPDNGSEFLNAHLLAFLEREFAATHCSRSCVAPRRWWGSSARRWGPTWGSRSTSPSSSSSARRSGWLARSSPST